MALLIQIATLVSGLGALVLPCLLYWQIREAKNASRAQLINDLQKELAAHHALLLRLDDGGDLNDADATVQPELLAQLMTLAAFCEKIAQFHRLNVLSTEEVKRMFEHRLTVICRNGLIQKHVISPRQGHFAAWAELSKSLGLAKSNLHTPALAAGMRRGKD